MLKLNGYRPLLVFLWVGISNPLFTQVESDFFDEIGLNPGTEISSNDLEILTQIFYLSGDDIDDFRTMILNLSISSEEDIDFLKHTSSFKSIYQYANASAPLLVRYLATKIEQLASAPQNGYFTFQLTQNTRIRYVGKIRIHDNVTQFGFTFTQEPTPSAARAIPSFYLLRKWTNRVLYLGDYQLLSGYGLLFWRSSSPYKGFDTINSIQRTQSRIAPFRSATNSWSMRGLALENTFGFGSLSLGCSQRRVNGEISGTGVTLRSGNWMQSSLSEKLTFVQAATSLKRGMIGGILAFSQYEDVHSTYTCLRRTLYGNVDICHANVFWEFVPGPNNSILTGIAYKKQSFKYVGLYRSLSGPASGSRQNPFSEWKNIERNESGVFQGVLVKGHQHFLSAYVDLYRQNDISKDSYFIKSGIEAGLRWQYHKRKLKLRVQLKSDEKSEDQTLYFSHIRPSDHNRNTQSFTSYYTLNKGQRIKIQIIRVASSTNNNSAVGNGGYLNWHFQQKYHFWDLALIKATVGDFSSRIYFWDLNLPGEMRSIMFTESGISLAVRYRYRFPLGGELGCRFRQNWRPDFSKTKGAQFGLILTAVF